MYNPTRVLAEVEWGEEQQDTFTCGCEWCGHGQIWIDKLPQPFNNVR